LFPSIAKPFALLGRSIVSTNSAAIMPHPSAANIATANRIFISSVIGSFLFGAWRPVAEASTKLARLKKRQRNLKYHMGIIS
jgi:hypothetical protein